MELGHIYRPCLLWYSGYGHLNYSLDHYCLHYFSGPFFRIRLTFFVLFLYEMCLRDLRHSLLEYSYYAGYVHWLEHHSLSHEWTLLPRSFLDPTFLIFWVHVAVFVLVLFVEVGVSSYRCLCWVGAAAATTPNHFACFLAEAPCDWWDDRRWRWCYDWLGSDHHGFYRVYSHLTTRL